MPPSRPCPPVEELRELMIGRTDHRTADRLAQHLEVCDRCADAVRQLGVDDALAECLRGEASLAGADDAEVHRLIDQLTRLQPTPNGEPSATLANDPGPAVAPLDATACDPEDLLAPPVHAGELGRLGPYEVLRVLGTGGMGVVYLARQDRPRRLVAVKMILAGPHAGRARLERFRAEAEVVARLQHPNIVPIYEVGEHEGRPYFSMEYLAGGSLAHRLACSLPRAHDAARLTETLARAIHYAHIQGVVHRDLKPANVLLQSVVRSPEPVAPGDDSSLLFATDHEPRATDCGPPKVTDFGLAKPLLSDAPAATETGAVLGTPSYMAPEQAAGDRDVGPAADVYALGAILYECLTGRPPFRADSPLETLDQVRSQEPVPPSRLQPAVPRDLQTICLKCLEKDPRRRYPSAAELADDLARFLRREPIRARPVSAVERLAKWARRKPTAAALLVVSVLAVVALTAGARLHAARLRAALDRAEASAAEARRQQEEAQKQGRRADANYHEARGAIRRMLDRLNAERLADVPRLQELRRDQLHDALTFYQGLLRDTDDPDPNVRYDAAVAYQQTALVYRSLERIAQGQENLARAIALLEPLAARYPARREFKAALARCYTDTPYFRGPPTDEDAERWHRRALELCQELVRDEPDNPAWQNALAQSYHNLGGVYLERNRPREAEPHLDQAIAIRRRLLAKAPGDPQYRLALAQDYVNQGNVYMQTQRREAADRLYGDAADLLKALLHDRPRGIEEINTLTALYVNWSYVLRDLGRAPAALHILNDAAAFVDDAVRREPGVGIYRYYALSAHGARAELYQRLKRYADALNDWDRVVELDNAPNRPLRRCQRALTRARAGDRAGAIAEADDLSRQPGLSPDGLYALAQVYSLGAGPGRYAERAIALLRRLERDGYFRAPEHARELRQDDELRPLHGRPEFEAMLKSLPREEPTPKHP